MAALDHPRKAEIEAVRRVIRGADPRILEGIKWNSPSFRTREWFATTHLRAKQGIAVILHLGAKARAEAAPEIDDPRGLLKWLGKDRAMVAFADLEEIEQGRAAFEGVLRQWIRHV